MIRPFFHGTDAIQLLFSRVGLAINLYSAAAVAFEELYGVFKKIWQYFPVVPP